MLQAAVDRLGRTVAGAWAVEVGQDVLGPLLQGSPERDDLGEGGGDASGDRLDEGRHQLLALRAVGVALARGAVDWDGVTSSSGACSSCDLSAAVQRDLGRFDTRDELFARHGQTLCWPARTLAEPVMSRWSAGAVASAA